MGKPSPPPAPDYTGAAKAQGQANIDAGQQTASLNNPNINGPYGSQSVSYAPTGPNGYMQPTINQSLTPNAQAALDAQQSVQASLAGLGQQGITQAKGILGSPFQYSGPGIQTSLGDYGSAQTDLDTSGVPQMAVHPGVTGQQAIMQRLAPQIEQQRAATQQRLANQGLTSGGEAYNNAMRDQGNQFNDLYSQASLYGIGLDQQANQQGFNQALQSGQFANQGQQQNYGQALGAGQFGNTAATQSLQQQLGLYNQPLNQITALMSGSQIQAPQFQQYAGGGQIGAAPIANATAQQGQFAQNLYGQQMAGYNSMIQGVSNLGAAAMFL